MPDAFSGDILSVRTHENVGVHSGTRRKGTTTAEHLKLVLTAIESLSTFSTAELLGASHRGQHRQAAGAVAPTGAALTRRMWAWIA